MCMFAGVANQLCPRGGCCQVVTQGEVGNDIYIIEEGSVTAQRVQNSALSTLISALQHNMIPC